MGFLLWIFVKIPLIIVILGAAMYLLYVKKMYDIVDAECTACDKTQEGKYRTIYRYLSIRDNVIEQTDKVIESNSPREVGEHYKLYVNKKFPTIVRRYDKVKYGAWSIILIAAILIFTL